MDFTVNANGTLVMLENFRKYCRKLFLFLCLQIKCMVICLIFLPLVELKTRYEIEDKHKWYNGIDETMSIDQSKHSLFGVSKIAGDVLVQEYGRYFNLKTVVFRGGCLTGPCTFRYFITWDFFHILCGVVFQEKIFYFGI